jgi:hypothetical protein
MLVPLPTIGVGLWSDVRPGFGGYSPVQTAIAGYTDLKAMDRTARAKTVAMDIDQAAGASTGNGETKGNGGNRMVSMWWVIVAFVGGGCAGVLLMALLVMAGGLPEQSVGRVDLSEMSG